MAFTEEQLRAIEAEGKVIVSASAGSGKTTVMIERIIRKIIAGTKIEEILAVTFTKKAAAQMKEKLSKALIDKINASDAETVDGLKKQLDGVANADISTIHGYCSKLIKRYFYAADVDGGFRVIDGEDAEGRALKAAALDELLEEGYESQDEDFLHLLSVYFRKKKDAPLRTLLAQAYNQLRGEANYRQTLEKNLRGYTEEDFSRVCAELLQAFQEKCRYYLSLIGEETAYFEKIEDGKKQLTLCRELTAWIESYLAVDDYFAAREVVKPSLTVNGSSKKDSAEKKGHIERLSFLRGKVMKLPAEFDKVGGKEEELAHFLSAGRTAGAIAKYLLAFDEKYAARKAERGALDYNDLEHKALELLQREEIASEVQSKYQYVFVDEYQDVNPVQEEIISRLSQGNLFLVGDVKQAIYGFRGSKSKYFAQKQAEFSRGGGKSLFMSYNFRSTDKVLDAVNAQFSLAMTPRVCSVDYKRDGRMERGGRYELNSGKTAIHIVGKEEKTPVVERGVYSVIENAKRKQEGVSRMASRMAQVIQEELNGYIQTPEGKRRVTYGDIAVLSRKKRGGIVEEVEALTSLGIPVTTSSAVNVCDFSEVKTLMDILSLLDNAEQDIPLCSALLSGMGKLTPDELVEIRLAYKGSFREGCRKYAQEKQGALGDKLRSFFAYFHALRGEAQAITVGELLAKILADTQMEATLLARKNGRASVKRLHRFLEEAASFGGSSVQDFLEHLRNVEYTILYSENGGENSVKVMTIHASKGLEFPIVLLPNLNAPFDSGDTPEAYIVEGYGIAPCAFDEEKMLRYPTLLRRLQEVREESSSIADELNLYYVALTRAERNLHLFFNEIPAMPDVKYAKSFADFTDFSVWQEYIAVETPFEMEKQPRQTLLGQANERTVDAILRAYRYSYPHAGYENFPVKSSPTRLLEGQSKLERVYLSEFGKEREEEIEKDGLAIQTGTAYHAFLEKFDFSLLYDGEKKAARSLLAARIEESLSSMQGVELALLSQDKLVEILSNPVFYTLRDCRLYKEQQFLVSLPVSQTYAKGGKEDGEEMLFQGAIDLLAVGEKTRIIDYKYSTRTAEELKLHYGPQLDLYRLAVGKILKIAPKEIACSIVNIRLGFEVEM